MQAIFDQDKKVYRFKKTKQELEIEFLKEKNAQLELDNLTTLEALAEVYELITGGA